MVDVSNTDRADYEASIVTDSDNSSQPGKNKDAELFRNTLFLDKYIYSQNYFIYNNLITR